MSTAQKDITKIITATLIAALIGYFVAGVFADRGTTEAVGKDLKAAAALQAKTDEKQDQILSDHTIRLNAQESNLERIADNLNITDRKVDRVIVILERMERKLP